MSSVSRSSLIHLRDKGGANLVQLAIDTLCLILYILVLEASASKAGWGNAGKQEPHATVSGNSAPGWIPAEHSAKRDPTAWPHVGASANTVGFDLSSPTKPPSARCRDNLPGSTSSGSTSGLPPARMSRSHPPDFLAPPLRSN